MKVEDEPNTPNIKKFIYEIFQSNTRVKIVKHRKKIEMQLENFFFFRSALYICLYIYCECETELKTRRLNDAKKLRLVAWLESWLQFLSPSLFGMLAVMLTFFRKSSHF